uniref:Uncharacterized protein n=1 Tax=Oryza barthii TaxID=65489 RepID=A0A0D3HV91_9ORYZ
MRKMAIEKATSVVAAATAASRGGAASPESGLSSTATPWMGGVLNVSTSGRWGWDTQGVRAQEVDHDGTGSVEGGDEDDDNADDLDDDYPPGMGGKKDGKEKKDSPKKKESPKGTDSKGKGGGKVQSAPPALRRATETMQKAFTLPVSIEPAKKDVGNTAIEVGKEGEDKAVVLWNTLETDAYISVPACELFRRWLPSSKREM